MRTGKRLGIIGCLLMEDEMVYALAKDSDIGEIVFVDNGERPSLFDKLRVIMPQVQMRIIKDDDIRDLPPPESFSLLIWMKDMGLHESPEKLKNDMSETLGRLRGVCDVILLFYGLCGNAF
ncbi:MAG: DUF1638 domain-containing protein, partial [Euryarchaeota archaeon]|nr:DUF1638 domain-containing protein [Euryarchaeota archaeon]